MQRNQSIIFATAFCLFSTLLFADSEESGNQWKTISLLDSQTQSQLTGAEAFFDKLFQLPEEYKNASKSEKLKLQKQWVKELSSPDIETATTAAANLGIVKSKPAAKFLEKAVLKKGGRFRWVCTRSLGQIRQKSSISVLIELLDNRQKDSQLYARVSLAEITGVYFGKDKEKWSAWYKDPSAANCTEDSCVIPIDSPSDNSPKPRETIEFVLPDTFGHIVSSEDYLGAPVLYIFGACWCGGCQQDMKSFREFIAKNQSTGLQGVRVVALDNELESLDFQKHYRLDCVQLLDTNRQLEKKLNNRQGWTFLVLADPDGHVVYRTNNPKESDYKAIYQILKSVSANTPVKAIKQNGVGYMPATLKRYSSGNPVVNERFPSIAAGPDGTIYVVYTASGEEPSDIMMRTFDGDQQPQDHVIVNTAADEYDGTVLVDSAGKIWICWTSNENGHYDIYITSLDKGSSTKAFQLTHSDDDAMHGRMACDVQGDLWVSYYRWKKHNGRSRDREVYVRKLSGGRWSPEIQISPTDVPWYEDHTEPAITAYQDGVMIAWSWDFHPPNQGYSQYTESPSIFLRSVNRQMEPGKIVSVSEKGVDVTPTLITSGDKVLCAWDTAAAAAKKIATACVLPTRDNPPENILQQHDNVHNVCSPCLSQSDTGKISLIWSESPNGKNWLLMNMTYLLQKNQWSKPSIILQDSNPRFPTATYDAQGRLWIAYSVEKDHDRKIESMMLVDRFRE